MPIDIVDLLEMVDVDHKDRQGYVLLDCPDKLLVEAGKPESTIIDVGQRVDGRQLLHLVVRHGVMKGKGQADAEKVQVIQHLRGESDIGGKHYSPQGQLLVNNRLNYDLARAKGGHHAFEHDIMGDVDHIALERLHRVKDEGVGTQGA